SADAAHRHPRSPARPRKPARWVPLPSALRVLRSGERAAPCSPDDGASIARARRAWSHRRLPSGLRRRGMSATVEVRSLSKRFLIGGLRGRAHVHAVDDVSFELQPGTITALVGESGSGKTTVARLIARLYEASNGAVLFEGSNVLRAKSRRQ